MSIILLTFFLLAEISVFILFPRPFLAFPTTSHSPSCHSENQPACDLVDSDVDVECASEHFAVDYNDARARFRAASVSAGADLSQYVHPYATGPSEELQLSIDVARIGPPQAESVLFLVSGIHGAEGFCGSGVQVGMLLDGHLASLPDNVAVVLVHALNPYGFAHLRRTNEDNIDLNRNFIHFADFLSMPENSEYEAVHQMLLPVHWTGRSREVADAEIRAFVAEHGEFAFQAAVTGGQYSHPDGLFYGGDAPAWSNTIWRQIVRHHASTASKVAVIDFHTGLGPYGHGEVIHLGDAESYLRAKEWYGDDTTSLNQGTSSSASVRGSMIGAIQEELAGEAEITTIALEFGTVPLHDVILALRADNWLHVHGKVESEEGRLIKQQVRDAFYADEPKWKRMVYERGVEMVTKAVTALSSDS